MRKFERRQRHSLTFGLFLAVMAALVVPAALTPRANAGSTDYDFEDPLGSRHRPAPVFFSQPQEMLINQSLASNYNPTPALNVAGNQPGAFQPLQVDANFSWTGAVGTAWSTAGNWSPVGPPGAADTAVFNSAFVSNRQPSVNVSGTQVGSLWMTDPVAQNVTIGIGLLLTINGTGIPGAGILIDNTNAFTLTILGNVALGGDQAWTNNSGNLFTVSGQPDLNNHTLTVNGTGNTTISNTILGSAAGSNLVKEGSGTLIVSGNNLFGYVGGTTVNGGTLLVNGASGNLGSGNVTVNNSGTTIGGNSTGSPAIAGRLTVNAGANLTPGNGGNNTANFRITALTLQPAANFRVDLNGTTVGSGYDRVTLGGGGAANAVIQGSNLVVHVGFAVTTATIFTIMQQVGGYTGQFAQGTSVVADNGDIFSITYAGDNINLQFTGMVVPEPSTWMGGALAIAGLTFTQRRRLRKLIARRCPVSS